MKTRRLIFYSGLYGGSAALLKLAGAALFFWLARALPVDGYAKFGLLYALQQGLASFAIAGIVEATVGLLKEHDGEGRGAFLYAAANRSFGVMALGSIAVALVIWLGSAGSTNVPAAANAAVLCSGVLLAFASLQAQLVRLQEQHLWSLFFNVGPQFAGFVGGLLVYLWFGTLTAFFVGTASGLIVALAFLRMLGVGLWSVASHGAPTGSVLRAAVPFIIVAVLGWLSGYGNNYVLNLFFPPVEIARFTFMLTVASVIQLVATALNQVWSPRFYRIIHQQQPESVEAGNRKFFGVQALALGLAGAVVILLFQPVIDLVGGNLVAYRSMKGQLALLFIAHLLLCPWWHCYNYYLAHARGPDLMRIVVITSVLGIGVWLTLMWSLGPIGIYIGFLAQMALRTIWIVMAARKSWPVKVSWEGVLGGTLLTLAGFAVAA